MVTIVIIIIIVIIGILIVVTIVIVIASSSFYCKTYDPLDGTFLARDFWEERFFPKQCVHTDGFFTVSVKAGSWSGCSPWAAAFYL